MSTDQLPNHASEVELINLTMARFMGKKSLEKSNRNKANRFKKSIEFFNRSNISIDRNFPSIENFYRFVLPFNLPIIT